MNTKTYLNPPFFLTTMITWFQDALVEKTGQISAYASHQEYNDLLD